MRNTLVDSKLYSLWIDQNHAHLGWLSAHQNRSDHRVDETRLTGTGCSSDQKVRHLGKICDDVAALNVFSDADG